jgi:hypothetical protein
VTGRDKPTNLLSYGIECSRKKFYETVACAIKVLRSLFMIITRVASSIKLRSQQRLTLVKIINYDRKLRSKLNRNLQS